MPIKTGLQSPLRANLMHLGARSITSWNMPSLMICFTEVRCSRALEVMPYKFRYGLMRAWPSIHLWDGIQIPICGFVTLLLMITYRRFSNLEGILLIGADSLFGIIL